MSYGELFDILYGYTIDHVILYNNGKGDTFSKYINSKDDLQRTLDSTNDLFNGGVKFIIGNSDDKSGISQHVISFIFDIKQKSYRVLKLQTIPIITRYTMPYQIKKLNIQLLNRL